MVDLNIELPEGFLDEEVRCGYTVTRQMKEVWAVELDLLVELDRVCKKYGIKYFADGGTILGAVRHQGFIPWDDDIDITMKREDYEELCRHFDDFKSPYFLQTNYTDSGSLRGHAQLRNSLTTGALVRETATWINQGIFIDIFPLDNVPNDDNLFFEQKKEIKILKNKAAIYRRVREKSTDKNKEFIKKILRRRPFTNFLLKRERKFYSNFEEECKKYNASDTLKISLLSFQCDWDRLIRNSSAYETIVMFPFEFFSIPLPAGYKQILRNLYGDYNKFVIGSSAHGNIIFNTNESYKTYLTKIQPDVTN